MIQKNLVLNVKIVNSYSWDIMFQPGYKASCLGLPSTTRGYAYGNRGCRCCWLSRGRSNDNTMM